MGPVFVILFWGIVLAVFAGGLLALGLLFAFASWKRMRWLKWSAGILFGGLIGLGFLVGGTIAFRIHQSSRPEWVFGEVFRDASTHSVQNIESAYWFVGDSGSIYLRFDCSYQTLKSLVATNFIAGGSDFWEMQLNRRANRPDWWPKEKLRGEVYYFRNPKGAGPGTFSEEDEIIAYEVAKQRAYYFYEGID